MAVLRPDSPHRASERRVSLASPVVSHFRHEDPVSVEPVGFSEDSVTRSIHQLPNELLACIFTYVLRTESCPTGPWFRGSEWFRLMNYPIILSHVCSSWRRVAIHLSTLWCRIYIHTELFNEPRSVALLETYIARSDQNVLDVCVLDPPPAGYPEPSTGWHTSDRFLEFIGSIASRTKYLVLRSSRGLFSGEHPRLTLTTCLGKCVPGILKELIVEIATYDYPVSQAPDMSLGLPRRTLEELWPSISVLRLNGYYPYAITTSNLNANRGLIELRLKGWHPITESTLIGILVASPQLRVLEVSIDIIGSLSKGPSVEPIYLENLEIVKSAITNRPLTHQRQLRILLRLLRPGPKPLSLCMSSPNQGFDANFVCQPEVKAFLDRSNVTQLYIYELEMRSHLVQLLKLVPSVQVLAVSTLRALKQDVGLLPSQPSLESLYVIPPFLSLLPGSVPSPSSDWPTVEWLVETYKPRKLTVWSQDFKFGYSGLGDSRKATTPENLYTVCPIVNVMGQEEPNPIQEWC